MICPNCGAEHDREQEGRFCNSCGISVLKYAGPEVGDELLPKVLCPACGMPSPPPVCYACGVKLPILEEGEEE